jgi:RimJ/RimL family protein N-acetyltransferase
MGLKGDLARNAARKTLFAVRGGYARRLNAGDEESLQAVLERCGDYFGLVTGQPPSSSAARELLQQLPEGKGREDKQVVGLYGVGDRLVGVLDAVRDYPAPHEWWLGLMLLEPQERNQGRGAEWYRAFESWVAEQGARQIRLGVVEQNGKGLRFWQRLGFESLEKRPSQRMGGRDNVTIVMRRFLEDQPGRVPKGGGAPVRG